MDSVEHRFGFLAIRVENLLILKAAEDDKGGGSRILFNRLVVLGNGLIAVVLALTTSTMQINITISLHL